MYTTAGFLKLLESNPDARKVFGERELKIIEKQAWAVELTQSEKNRLSRDIRRKLDFICQVARFSDAFQLKKGASVKEQAEEVVQAIKRDSAFVKIRRIWLFGSSVQGKRALRSDLDIAVEFDSVTKGEALAFRRRILGNFDERVDIQVLNVLPENVQAEVHREGKVLHEHAN